MIRLRSTQGSAPCPAEPRACHAAPTAVAERSASSFVFTTLRRPRLGPAARVVSWADPAARERSRSVRVAFMVLCATPVPDPRVAALPDQAMAEAKRETEGGRVRERLRPLA